MWSIFTVLFVFLIVIIVPYRHEFISSLLQMRASLLFAAVVVTALSYALAGFGFIVVGKIFGLHMPRRKMFKIAIITIAINYLTSIGGVAGYTIRTLLMRREGVRPRDTIAASLFFSYLYTFTVAAILPFALLYLYAVSDIPLLVGAIFIISAVLDIAFFTLATLFIFDTNWREKIFNWIGHLGRLARWINIEKALGGFSGALKKGSDALRQNPGRIAVALVFIVGDFILSAGVLWLSLFAFGISISPLALFAGFLVSVVVGLISMIPGGLGSQDISLVGILAIFGVSAGQAIAAVLIFRVVYYIIPFAVALLSYGYILKGSRRRKERYI